MRFARVVFLVAGVYGLIVLLPMYFLEAKTGRDFPPAITHPEYYYGFIGVAVAWQVVFLILSSDPLRFYPMMMPSILEKLVFGVPALVLFLAGRLSSVTFGVAMIDVFLGVLFLIALLKCRSANPHPS